jgi:hypothetical protein
MLLKQTESDGHAKQLAEDVIGALVVKNKKLWRDLRRFANASDEALRRAAVRACRRPLLDDTDAFPRFLEVSEPLFADADAALQQAIDELLIAAAAVHADAVRELAERHGRKLTLPRKKAAKKATSKPAEEPGAVKTTAPTSGGTRKKAAKKRPAAGRD